MVKIVIQIHWFLWYWGAFVNCRYNSGHRLNGYVRRTGEKREEEQKTITKRVSQVTQLVWVENVVETFHFAQCLMMIRQMYGLFGTSNEKRMFTYRGQENKTQWPVKSKISFRNLSQRIEERRTNSQSIGSRVNVLWKILSDSWGNWVYLSSADDI
jgi:hypothetical protein